MKISEMKREELAERLILSVLNAEESNERLFNFPNIIKGGFALVSQLCLGDKNIDGQYTSCITVTNDILNGWDISKFEMFDLAIQNSRSLFPVLVEPLDSMTGVLSGSEKGLFHTDGVNLPNCYILTNKGFFNGAAALFYEPDVLNRLSKKCRADNIYLFPSSTNHIFCIPSSNLLSKEECTELQSALFSESEEKPLFDKIMVYDNTDSMVLFDDRKFALSLNEVSGRSISQDFQTKGIHR